jgi:diguanylate cyclase (GGDEF)-like protein
MNRRLTLTAKVMLMLGAAWTAATACIVIVQVAIVLPTFIVLEEREGRKDATRVSETIAGAFTALAKTTRDWAAWEETWMFVRDGNAAYTRSNLTEETFKTLDVDAMVFLDANGRLVWGRVVDPVTGVELDPPELSPKAFSPRHPLSWPADTKGPYEKAIKREFLRTGAGIMMVASAPVLRNYEEGPVNGALIEGKFLSERFFDKVREQTRVSFRVEPLAAGSAVPAGDDVRIALAGGFMRLSFFIRDGLRAPLARVTIERPADIVGRGRVTFVFSLGLLFIALAGTIVAVLLLLRRTVLDPIERLTRMIVSIRTTGTYVARLGLRRTDEIGTLSSNFDAMLDQLSEKTRALLEMATTDALTGVPNRRAIMEALAKEVARARRYGEPLAALMIDIDHFKALNDVNGHAVGDEALKIVAGTLRSTIRDADFIGRFGGEEFLVILPHQDGRGAMMAAERLRRRIAGTEIRAGEMNAGKGRPLKLTVSIGVGTLMENGMEDMLLRAD